MEAPPVGRAKDGSFGLPNGNESFNKNRPVLQERLERVPLDQVLVAIKVWVSRVGVRAGWVGLKGN